VAYAHDNDYDDIQQIKSNPTAPRVDCQLLASHASELRPQVLQLPDVISGSAPPEGLPGEPCNCVARPRPRSVRADPGQLNR
jgi:hypothetical protein